MKSAPLKVQVEETGALWSLLLPSVPQKLSQCCWNVRSALRDSICVVLLPVLRISLAICRIIRHLRVSAENRTALE